MRRRWRIPHCRIPLERPKSAFRPRVVIAMCAAAVCVMTCILAAAFHTPLGVVWPFPGNCVQV